MFYMIFLKAQKENILKYCDHVDQQSYSISSLSYAFDL